MPVEPRLADLPTRLRERFNWAAEDGVLVISGTLDRDDLRILRDCDHSPQWQVIVDRISAACRVHDDHAGSNFPTTMWGLLLQQLDSGESQHWEQFIECYRTPIRKSVQRMLSVAGRQEGAADLAEGFFGWFAAREIWRKLRRVDPDSGRVFRFRGYLLCCVRTYLGEEVFNRRSREIAVPSDDAVFEVSGEDENIIDDVFCEDAVVTAMEAIREVDRELWNALVDDFAGRTLTEVAERMKKGSVRGVGSVGTAHSHRHRARKCLQDVLVRYRLRDVSTTEEEAMDEFVELIPLLARHVAAYVDAHAADRQMR